MKVYVLTADTADTYDKRYGASIEIFGVFSTKEKAQKRANEIKLELDDYKISPMNIDENERPSYLGGYIE